MRMPSGSTAKRGNNDSADSRFAVTLALNVGFRCFGAASAETCPVKRQRMTNAAMNSRFIVVFSVGKSKAELYPVIPGCVKWLVRTTEQECNLLVLDLG